MTLKPCDKWDDISCSIEVCIAEISIWINSSISVRNVGLMLDNTLRMEKDVSPVVIK